MNKDDAQAWLATKHSLFVYMKDVRYADNKGRREAYAEADKHIRTTSPNLLAVIGDSDVAIGGTV